MQALEWWATNLTLRGKQVDLTDFDATVVAHCIDESKLYYEDGKMDPDIQKPDKFLHRKWYLGRR